MSNDVASDVDQPAEVKEEVTDEKVSTRQTFHVDVPNDDLAEFIPSGPGGMRSGWRDYFYAVVSKVWPYCSVVWQNNYFLKKTHTGSRQWKANGRCRVQDCVNACLQGDMSLQSDTHTRIAVTITGQCQHLQGKQHGENDPVMRNRVQLRGKRRKAFAEWLSETGQKPTELELVLQTVGTNDDP